MRAPRKSPRRSGGSVPLDRILKSLGDPIRLSIVKQLLLASEGEKACGCFEYDVTKPTFSHHMAVLEDAGIVQGRAVGTRRMISLRLEALERDYPGLLDLVRAAS